MALQFATLASGSSGNASLVVNADQCVLIDCGLGPRQLATRLNSVGAAWRRVQAVLLTHTHGDHRNERTLAYLHRLGVPFYCHAGHEAELLRWSPAFANLRQNSLVHNYEAGVELDLPVGLRVRPVPIRHDGGPTFAFRIEGPADAFGQSNALSYAADLGCWDSSLVEALADVDLLALEFNHDVTLERLSSRSPHLIARVLGDDGHLSNGQAGEFLQEIIRRAPGRLRHVVQLHLSRDCNRQEIAQAAARRIVGEAIAVHTASQDDPGPVLCLGKPAPPRQRGTLSRRKPKRQALFEQAWLPGLDDRAR